MDSIKRILQDRIADRIEPNKVILIFGAHRTGKTLLLRQLMKNFQGRTLWLNGEDYDVTALLENRSVANYRRIFEGIELVAIDEVRHIADIIAKLKLIVDEIPNIRVIASAPCFLDLSNSNGVSLTGRSAQFLLLPFSQKELTQIENGLEVRQNLETRLIYGAYPEVLAINRYEEKADYLRNIASLYLLKDVLQIHELKNAKKMKELLRIIALRVGSEIAYDELGQQLDMSKNTVEKYMDILSKLFIIYRLGTYHTTLKKEVTKSGKWYFFDNGIRNAIIGNFSPLALRQDVDALWENYLINERLKENFNEGLGKDFYFWRTYDRQEVELIEATSDSLSAMGFAWEEKKRTNAPKAFRETYPNIEYDLITRDNYLEHIIY